MINRKIKITISDPDSIWKEIEQEIFSDFSFQLPTIFPEQVPNDIGANLSFDFFPEDPNLTNYIKPGSDPFLSSFFSIRVQKISDDPNKYQSFQRWVDNAKNCEIPWCVFLIQERFLFISQNAGLFSQLDFIPLERLFTIQYKSPLRLAEQQKEQIQTKFQDIITESFLECDSKTLDIIHLGKYPASKTTHYIVWRYLMFFFFGFLDTAIKRFYGLYTEFSKSDLKCDIIPPIEPSWITLYPFINGDDDISILIFALSGCFASYYIKKDYYKILELFMRNLAILHSKSSIDKNLVLNWASQSLEVMIDLDFSHIQEITDNESNDEKEIENNDNSTNITEQLLMQLFKNRLLNGNQKQIDEVYHKLMIRLSEKKFSRTGLNVLYSNNQIFNELTECWSFGQKAALDLVEEAIKGQKYSRIQFFAKSLFFDCTPDEIKINLFNTLSKLDSEVLIKDPFFCKIKCQSDAFCKTVKNNYTFYVNIKCSSKTINLFPNLYDSATLSLQMIKDEKDGETEYITHQFTSTNVNIDDFQISAFLNESGKWNFDYLEVRKGSLAFRWKIDADYCVYVSEYERPNINVTFPSLIGFCQLLPITFSVDFTTIEKVDTEFKLFFDSPSLIIPDQHGTTEIQLNNSQPQTSKTTANSNSAFNVTDSVLTFTQSVDRSEFDCDSKFVARINCKQNGKVDSSNLHVIASVSGTKYEFLFKVVFIFPIECSLRFISEKFAHICLRNTASVPFIIESAEMQPSTWGKQVINAGEELFLIGKRSYENDVLKAFIRDESGSSIAMSWDINEKMMRPVIEAEIKGNPICGRALKIKLLNVPQCEFHIENTKNFVISGITNIEEFKGGSLAFSLIPLKSGQLRLPFISLNHISHVIQQEYITVNQPKGTLLSPLVK